MTIRILLVDDNQTFVSAVQQYLDLVPGVSVVGQAYDGRMAMTKIALLQPQLVLLDVAMPEMNGLEVARRLQSWPQPPRVVFLSMHDNVAYRKAASNFGAVGFVSKADFVVELLPIIECLVANEHLGEGAC